MRSIRHFLVGWPESWDWVRVATKWGEPQKSSEYIQLCHYRKATPILPINSQIKLEIDSLLPAMQLFTV